jgi:hypothetical protein
LGKGGATGSGGMVATGGTSAAGPIQMVDAAHVRLLSGSPFYDRQELHCEGTLAQLDTDKLLYEYRNFAKVPQAVAVFFGPVLLTPMAYKVQNAGAATGTTFRPLYDLHHQRYSVYWPWASK